MVLNLFDVILAATTLLCGLVTGLLFGFAIVVMPGIGKLSDQEFLRAFKMMDQVIQNRQPHFMFVWVGSIVLIGLMSVLGTIQLNGSDLYLMWFGSCTYLFAVQGTTIRFNIPLNNTLQNLELDLLSEPELARSRVFFEKPWNRWNRFRTMAGFVSVVALLALSHLQG